MSCLAASKWTITHIPKKNMSAGSVAAIMTSRNGVPVNSTIRNAAAPITGGRIWPPEETDDSTAPANSEEYPDRFISGIVNAPVVTVFATDEPESIPIIQSQGRAYGQ